MRADWVVGQPRGRGSTRSAVIFGAVLLLPARVQAQNHELQRVQARTLSLEVGATLFLAGGAQLLPTSKFCRWCEPPGIDESLALPADPSNRRHVALASHALSLVFLPVLAVSAVAVPPLVRNERTSHGFENFAIISEAALFDVFVTTVVKRVAARQRPAFHYRRLTSCEYADFPGQENVSFFSGDTSVAFALASSASTLSFQRGYRSAPYVTAASALLASATAVLRVRADVHWATDVMTGALVGTAIGIAAPLLLHPRVVTSDNSVMSGLSAPDLGSEPQLLQLGGRF
jgi:membrane-associated phospholipid phosphatase